MATQNAGLVPIKFSISSSFRNVRLMEAPEEVLAIINSTQKDVSGKTESIKFKSAPPVTSSLNLHSSASKATDSILHLCSNDKTWAVKQVSTSNSVYLIQPVNAPAREDRLHDDTEMTGDETATLDDLRSAARADVSAIAQVGSFLELHPVKVDDKEVALAIQQLVPVYDSSTEGLGSRELITASNVETNPISLNSLLNNVASPDSIVRRVCAKLCLFENIASERGDPSSLPSSCYIPTPSAKLEVWSKIFEGCVIDFIKLDHAINVERIVGILDDDDHKAIARVLLEPGVGTLHHLGLLQPGSGLSLGRNHNGGDGQSSDSASSSTAPQYLKPLEMSLFVAILLLSASGAAHSPSTSLREKTDGNSIQRPKVGSFIEKWTNLVPSSFVKYCTIESLKTIRSVSISKASSSDITDDNDEISWSQDAMNFVEGLPVVPDSNGTSVTSAAPTDSAVGKSTATGTGAGSANTTGKRKWHEKFGAQRNTKK